SSGRAYKSSRRRIGGVARTTPSEISRHSDRGDARSLLSRQRRRLDSGARPGSRHPVGRKLLFVARAKTREAATRGKGRESTSEDSRARAGVDKDGSTRATCEIKGANKRLRAIALAGKRKAGPRTRDLYSSRTSTRRRCDRSQIGDQVLWR